MNVNKIPALRDIYTLDLLRNAMYIQSQELRIQNYLFDLIHSYCFTIIQYNIIVHNL